MGVSWNWDSELDGAIVVRYTGSWSVGDSDTIVKAIAKAARNSVFEKVDYISVFAPDSQLPAGSYQQGRQDMQIDQSHVGLVVFVGLSGMGQATIKAAEASLNQPASYNYQMARDMAHARQLIIAYRASLKKRGAGTA